jgi:hypothetical protein
MPSYEELLRFLNDRSSPMPARLSLESDLQPASAEVEARRRLIERSAAPGSTRWIVVGRRARCPRAVRPSPACPELHARQEIHIVNDLDRPDLGAWFSCSIGADRLRTPEWDFRLGQRRTVLKRVVIASIAAHLAALRSDLTRHLGRIRLDRFAAACPQRPRLGRSR